MGTIYQSIYCSPDSVGIDMSQNQVFSCQVQGGEITDYQLIIKDLANTTLYDSTKISLSPSLYNGDTLEITVTGGSVVATGRLKYTITVWSGANSATTREVPFYSASIPTATLTIASPVTTKQVDLTTVYSQAESVPVQSYQYFLYNSDGTILIDSSSVIYSEKLTHSFDGLIDGTTYQVKCVITNTYSQEVDTGLVSFTVDYTEPNINITPSVEVDEDLSAIKVGIGEVVQNIGNSTGTIAYIDDFLTLENVGLQLADSSSTAYWDVEIPENFTATFDWVADGFVSGKIIRFDNDSGNYMEIGYDGTNFYLDIDGTIVNGTALVLNSSAYVFGVKNQELVICQGNTIIDHIRPWWDQ